MKKHLNEMTLEELWELFPISLVPHRKEWKVIFNDEKNLLLDIFYTIDTKSIEHIGSTAIPSIYAKDIVDILIEVDSKNFIRAIEILKSNGYILMNESKNRATFNKGYTENGFADKVFHLHLRQNNDIDELYFRDYLIDFSVIAKDYEKLKLGIWKQYEHNRDAYTKAKTKFIKDMTLKAKQLYKNRYKLH